MASFGNARSNRWSRRAGVGLIRKLDRLKEDAAGFLAERPANLRWKIAVALHPKEDVLADREGLRDGQAKTARRHIGDLHGELGSIGENEHSVL